MLSIRGGSGLGDSLYLQAIVRHLVMRGVAIEACTNWPDLFGPLLRRAPGRLTLSPFRKDRIDRVAHYTTRKSSLETDQFQDCCIRAEIREPVELRLDWEVSHRDLVETIGRQPRPVIAVALPRAPMGRSDSFGAELFPDCWALQRAVDRLREMGASVVQVGAGAPLYHLTGLSLDLANRTTVAQLLDVAAIADGFLGQVSFIAPLAESLGKPALIVWARAGLASKEAFVRAVTPRKVLHRGTSGAVFDDADGSEIEDAADALYLACRDG